MKKGIRMNVSGWTCTGKTYLIRKLIPFLEANGYTVVQLDPNETTEDGYREMEDKFDIIITEETKMMVSSANLGQPYIPSRNVFRDEVE